MTRYIYEEKTASGDVVLIGDGADRVPLKNWLVTLPASLSGVSSVGCTQTGKNLLPNKTYQRNTTTLRIGTDTLDGTLKFQAGTYTLSVQTALTGATLNYTSSGSTTSISTSTDGDYRKGTFTLSKETELFFGCYNSGGITSAQVSELQLEVGNSRTAYNAYNSTTHTVSLGQTIYGGEADVVNGTGKSTHGMLTLTADMINSATSYSYQSKNGIQIASVFPVNVIRTGNHICSAETVRQGASSDASYMWFGSATGNKYLYWIGVLDTMEMTLEQWKTWALSQTIVCVYEEPTPTDFTFDGQEIQTQLGYNAFWCDSGDTEVTYYTRIPVDETYIINGETLSNIADAIRTKRESTSPILTEDMADEILNINAGTNDPFTKVWTSGQTGEETFTCSEEGKYLFLIATSYQGTSSISSSITPEYTFEKKGSNGEGLMGAIFNLSVGDTVTMINTVSDWVASAKIIFRFNLTVSSVISDTLVRDTQLSSFAPTFTGSALFIYMAWGRTDNNSYDRTYSTNNFEWASKVNSQTYFRLSYGENTPSVNMYGYDGGGVVAICLQ